MNAAGFDRLVRAMTEGVSATGALSRRSLARGLAGTAIVAGLAWPALDDAGAKKGKGNKGKGKKRKGEKRQGNAGGNDGGNDGGGNDGGNGGGNNGGNECPLTICEGQCVDLESDRENCGACGDECPEESTCVEGQCVQAIGSQGSGDNELDSPAGIAFDGDESFLVTDSGNQRVVSLFGDTFRGNLNVGPFGIAVNTVTADVYVTGADTSTLHRFNSDGTLLGTFGSFGGGVEQFENPLGVAVDDKGDRPSNQVFVADTGNSRIQRISDTGFFTARFGSEGSGDGQFRNPEGIAIDANRNVVVADTGNNRIQVLNQDGQLIRAFGTQGSGNGQFNRPVAVAIAENGDIFIVDQGNNRVQQFSSDGQFLDAFGRQGTGIGQFDRPTGITVANTESG